VDLVSKRLHAKRCKYIVLVSDLMAGMTVSRGLLAAVTRSNRAIGYSEDQTRSQSNTARPSIPLGSCALLLQMAYVPMH
jgi:hypothetical protein